MRQFIEMVSGADSLDTETTMYGGRAADSSSEDMEETLDNEAHCGDHSANGNTSRNGNVEEESTPEAETPSESMEVDPAQRGTGTSILSNPARFEALIRSLSLSLSTYYLSCRFHLSGLDEACSSSQFNWSRRKGGTRRTPQCFRSLSMPFFSIHD